MKRAVIIEDAGGSREVAHDAFPLSVGGPGAAVPLPGMLAGEPVAWIGREEGELFLQAASFVARRAGARAAPGDSEAASVILCVGDSHTYGLPLPKEESYPAQLEEKVTAHGGGGNR